LGSDVSNYLQQACIEFIEDNVIYDPDVGVYSTQCLMKRLVGQEQLKSLVLYSMENFKRNYASLYDLGAASVKMYGYGKGPDVYDIRELFFPCLVGHYASTLFINFDINWQLRYHFSEDHKDNDWMLFDCSWPPGCTNHPKFKQR